jgi:hypothetical protein
VGGEGAVPPSHSSRRARKRPVEPLPEDRQRGRLDLGVKVTGRWRWPGGRYEANTAKGNQAAIKE